MSARDDKIRQAFEDASSEELTEWFALSFADESGFLGGAYVRASSQETAWARSHELGLNPGGEVQIMGPLPAMEFESDVAEGDRERLLTREEWA